MQITMAIFWIKFVLYAGGKMRGCPIREVYGSSKIMVHTELIRVRNCKIFTEPPSDTFHIVRTYNLVIFTCLNYWMSHLEESYLKLTKRLMPWWATGWLPVLVLSTLSWLKTGQNNGKVYWSWGWLCGKIITICLFFKQRLVYIWLFLVTNIVVFKPARIHTQIVTINYLCSGTIETLQD